MDVFKADYKDHSNDGVEYILIDPVTREPFGIEDADGKVTQVFKMRLLSISAPAVKAADRQFKKLHPSRTWAEEESKDYRKALCVAACVGWEGSEVAFDQEAAKKLFDVDWIAAKVFAFILDGDRFLSA